MFAGVRRPVHLIGQQGEWSKPPIWRRAREARALIQEMFGATSIAFAEMMTCVFYPETG